MGADVPIPGEKRERKGANNDDFACFFAAGEKPGREKLYGPKAWVFEPCHRACVSAAGALPTRVAMRALIAMSGGVDSSVAAKLTADLGYDCIGCTMKLYQNEDAGLPRSHSCCSLEDVQDARSVACKLHMPYYVFNFSDDFRQKIIEPFLRGYEAGITPNPCIDCNRYMKFEKLYERANILGCAYIVTGHYARISYDGVRYSLKKALDASKDQSYVLYAMTQQQLAHTLFPLGELKKSETRRIAAQQGFYNADKPDSQDICFVPDGDHAKIIQLHTGRTCQPGDFVDATGTVVGRHAGIIHYTVGQRRGLGLSGPRAWYVQKICPQTNTVVVGPESQLYGKRVSVGDFHWISGTVPTGSIRCKAKIRYRQPEQWATVVPQDAHRVEILFDEPQRAIAPGQAAVLYDEETVLGGGVILPPDEGLPPVAASV